MLSSTVSETFTISIAATYTPAASTITQACTLPASIITSVVIDTLTMPTTMSIITTTTAQPLTCTPALSPSTDCSNGTIYQSQWTSSTNFTELCGIDQFGTNIGSVFVYTFEDCMGLCAGMNFWNSNQKCKAVSYLPASGRRPANCWVHSLRDDFVGINTGGVNSAVLN
jgi:hypothetical protein